MTEHLVSLSVDTSELVSQLEKMTREEVEAINLEDPSLFEISRLPISDDHNIVFGITLR